MCLPLRSILRLCATVSSRKENDLLRSPEVQPTGRTAASQRARFQALKVILDTFAPGKWIIIACLIIK
jgi:hypothetical protein